MSKTFKLMFPRYEKRKESKKVIFVYANVLIYYNAKLWRYHFLLIAVWTSVFVACIKQKCSVKSFMAMWSIKVLSN